MSNNLPIEAMVLRQKLEGGTININELKSFLNKVELEGQPKQTKPKTAMSDRVLRKLEKLDKLTNRKIS